MNKKVIFLIGTLAGGGAERVVSNLSLNLSKEIEVEIILFGKDAKIDYEYSGNITYLDKSQPVGIYGKLKVFFTRIKKLNKIKKRNESVPVISFLEYPNLLNMLAGNTRNSLVSVRNFMSVKHQKGFKSFFWNSSIKYLYRRARAIIVVSEAMKMDLKDVYALPEEKIEVIYNSYSIKNILELSKVKLSLEEMKVFEKPTIITVGRMSKQKGHIHLIRSFKKVIEHMPEAQLVILGEGNLKGALQNLITDLKLDNNVHLWGFQQNPFKYIANSKVFVMSSYYEGFPNALAEAMACRVPVISTDCPSGPKEILAPYEYNKNINYNEHKHRYGILVPKISIENEVEVEDLICDSILKIITNNEISHSFSVKSFERINDFDISNIIKEWESIIHDSP